jgi:sterol desaturase/sphingolipid hydroxylase (fatty acid hydroxylase superfamily)
MGDIPQVFAAFALVLVLMEATWSRVTARRVYNLKESLSNFSMALVNAALKPLTLAWIVFIASLVEPLQVIPLPKTVWTFLATFVIADLAFYWYHRLSHEMPVLWTMHHTHHSSPWMNFTTAMRLNWIAKFVSPLFYIPLVVLGIPAEFLGSSLALGLMFQFLLHTEAVGKLGRFEGKLFNTPSAHRVHHGSNTKYIDRNYAGVFIVWDRMFGTYQPEEEPVRYGVTSGFVGHNPLVVQLQPIWKYICGNWRREKQPVAERTASRQGNDGLEQTT